jgi:hypothetical protein
MADLGTTAVGVHAVRTQNLLKLNMTTALTPALAQKAKLVRYPAPVRTAKAVQ